MTRTGGTNISVLETQAKASPVCGHCYRVGKEIISSLILRRPMDRVQSRKLTFLKVIIRVAGPDSRGLSTAMANRGVSDENSINVPSTQVVEGR